MSDEFLEVGCSRRVSGKARSDASLCSRGFPHYRMDLPRRGVAAIFNHERFDNCAVSERKGSEKDVESLCHTLSRLGFEVETFCDLTVKELIIALEDLCQRDHSKCDCFLLVFMSHGLEGKLRSRDVVFDVNLLWDCFDHHRAPTLLNKPKIFIIQACQGHGRQCGVRVAEDEVAENFGEVDDRVTLVPGYNLPSSPDFLIALSTIPGFVSWRNPVKGSWYIQTLCEHLDRNGFEQDLVTLLTHVGREIAIEYSVIDVQDISNVYKKQLPSIISLLVRKIHFTRKKVKSCGSSRKRDREDSSTEMEEDLSSEKENPKVQNNTSKIRNCRMHKVQRRS